MDLPTFEQLLSPAGQAALAAAEALAPAEPHFLAHLSRLEKDHPPALAKAALETALLRHKARLKFSRAGRMYFTREALEQASGETVSRWRAERYASFGPVGDLGCGIGGDTLALAGRGPVTAVEQDPLRLAMARENARAYGCGRHITWLNADLTREALPPAEALFFDPGRRAGGRRRFSVEAYQPPLSAIRAWLLQTPALGVKISPGVDLAELAGYDCEVEFISDGGELKECALWFGPLRTARHRASLLPGRHSLTEAALPAAPPPLSAPRAYLYEPDPAILRAGLVAALAGELDAAQLDPDIAYLTSDALRPTPFARAFTIEEHFPFQLKRLRQRLRQLGVGQVTVKKRGSPLEPEALIHQLRLRGSESRVVLLTHLAGRPHVLLARPA